MTIRAAAPESEAGFQAAVVELALLLSWQVFHPFDSRRSAAGWPDLSMVRDGRLILAELKSARGRVTPEQREWLAALEQVAAASGGAVSVHLWRPADFPCIEAELRRHA